MTIDLNNEALKIGEWGQSPFRVAMEWVEERAEQWVAAATDKLPSTVEIMEAAVSQAPRGWKHTEDGDTLLFDEVLRQHMIQAFIKRATSLIEDERIVRRIRKVDPTFNEYDLFYYQFAKMIVDANTAPFRMGYVVMVNIDSHYLTDDVTELAKRYGAANFEVSPDQIKVVYMGDKRA